MKYPPWLLEAARKERLPKEAPGPYLPSGGRADDLNVTVRGLVANGTFAESKPPEEPAFEISGTSRAVTWGEVAARCQEDLGAILAHLRERPDFAFLTTERAEPKQPRPPRGIRF